MLSTILPVFLDILPGLPLINPLLGRPSNIADPDPGSRIVKVPLNTPDVQLALI